MANEILTQERLKELLHYNPETGIFIWIVRTGMRNKVGCVAGTKNPTGYIQIGIDRKFYRVHRLAFLYMTGYCDETKAVDHINGIRDDNRYCNLRLVCALENRQNQKKAQINNKLGFLGVSASRGKIRAIIMSNGKKSYLGYFETPELAHQAYLVAKRELHSSCTI